MNTEHIIQQSRNESDKLMLKMFKAVPIFTIVDLLLILLVKGKLTLIEIPIAVGIFIAMIPVLYYKYSTDRKHFFIISILCVEGITLSIYISSWFYASLLLIVSLLVCTLYLDTKVIKRMLVIKLPLLILGNYMSHKVNSDFVFVANQSTFISTCVYYMLQFVIIGYICSYVSKKTTGVLDTFIDQNASLNTLLDKNYESTERINQTINNLSSNIGKNSMGVETIAKSSTNISVKAQDMSHKACESKVAFERISDEIQDTSRKSNEIFELTQNMSELTIKNKGNMQDLASQMNELKLKNQSSKVQFSELKETTSEISHALKIINEISEETNLISLNASIEAARAGESGKSFAVVAAEIKKLATQTAQSVEYIEQIVRRVDTSMEASVEAITHTDEMIEHNVEKLVVALQDFDKMVEFQKKVSDKIFESQKLIQGLRSHVTEVAESIDATMQDSKETSNSIMEISAILEEMSLGLNEISHDAREVQQYSNELVNVQLN